MKYIDLLLGILVLFLLWQEKAWSDPHWFPTKPCSAQNSNYDFNKDAIPTALGNQGYKNYAARAQRDKCYKQWTVLIFMTVGDDLKPYALWDIAEMERTRSSDRFRSASTEKSDVILEYNIPTKTQTRRLHLFESKNPYSETLSENDFLQSIEADIQSPLVKIFNRDPKKPPEYSLSYFLRWGMRAYPAKNYMVVIWGHAGGWKAGNQNDRSVYSNVPLLGQALRSAVSQTLEGKPIDIFATDACLMQTVEVSTEISDVTSYIVGSAQVQPYSGLPYGRIMAALNSNREAIPNEAMVIAKLIPELSPLIVTDPSGRVGEKMNHLEWTTLSSISSIHLRTRLVPALYNLSNLLKGYMASESLRRLQLQQIIRQTPGYLGGFKESGDFLSLLHEKISDPAMQTTVDAVNQALDFTVIRSVLGNQYSKSARGLSIWLPETKDEFLLRDEEFRRSAFYTGGWGDWLASLFELGGLGEISVRLN